ncbi:MAG TPA: ABC transporter ATP-binding protein [Thermohalobaculum sp.]|nr:ABC transporter ATP-binding protein [Thermohalobaculum sp.]
MAEPVLELRGVVKRFGAVQAAGGVDLTLMRGEIHALIGPNGAGKSTLVQIIAGQLRQDAGEIRIGGREVSRLSVAGRARLGLGRTFQVSSVALEFSALRNVMLAVQGRERRGPGLMRPMMRPVMRDAQLTRPALDVLAQFDLDDRAGVPAAALSHGELRQLELAMAFALAPRLLLLDEPMAGIGAGGTPALTRVLLGLRGRVPMLLIEHDMDAVFRLADRISVLAEGRVIFSGPPDAVRASALVREVYLGAEA